MTDSDSSNSGPTELQSQRAAAQSVTAQLDSLWQARWLDCRESYRAAERSLAALGHRDDPDSIAVSYRALAWCARWKGEFLLARDYCDRALRHLATSPNADIEGAVLSILAQVEFCLGDPAAAIARVDRGMQVIADVSAGETHIDLLSTDAALLRYQNETARAAEVLQSALQIASGRFPNDVLRVKCNMARLQAQLGDLVAARATAEHLLNKVVGTPGHLLLGYTYEVLGSVALLQKDMDAAKQYIEAGLMLAVDRGDKRLECEIRGCVASYHTANGDLTRALDSARTGLQVAESLKFRLWEVIYLEQVAGLYEQLGEFSKALTWYKRFHDQKSAILTSSFTLRERQQQSARQVQLLQSESMLASEKDSLIKVENDKRERMRRELSWASIRDNLSGLLKREAFDRKLTTLTHETRGSADQHVLLYIDVDNFASFNDELGYGAGDRLLQQIAVVLQRIVRASDTLSRLQGDKFAVILHGCDYPAAQQVAQKCCGAVESLRVEEQGQVRKVTCSIGMVLIDAHSGDAEALLKRADSACCLAKEKGRNRVQRDSEQSDDSIGYTDQLQWVNRINEALQHDLFDLFYQPISRLNTEPGDCSHVEVLLRMRSSDGEIAFPIEFMPAAERYGLMPAIDRWVLRKVVDWVLLNRAAMGDKRIAINLSGASLSEAKFFSYAREQISKLEGGRAPLIFEITESSAIHNFHHLQGFIAQMGKSGVEFSLDDFGSGLSSFAYLKTLDIHYLKIDGSFVRDMAQDRRDYAIVNSINHIGQSIGLATIAEFVESEEILQALQEIGVDYGQGYALGAPQPLREFLVEPVALAS